MTDSLCHSSTPGVISTKAAQQPRGEILPDTDSSYYPKQTEPSSCHPEQAKRVEGSPSQADLNPQQRNPSTSCVISTKAAQQPRGEISPVSDSNPLQGDPSTTLGMTKDTPLITFIIPTYKALPWLERSLSSIRAAEAKVHLPIEIMICDDASPDDTGKLVDTLAASDPRIVPLHNERNGSVCYSRNRCLDLAKGTWICFVDQDDVLDENAFEVFRKTLDNESQIIYYGFQDFYDGAEIPMGDGNPGQEKVFTGEDIRKLQWDCLCRYKDSAPLISYRLLPVPWGKLYRRFFLEEHHVRFREGLHREEDIGFNFMALAHCARAKSCPYPLYHYRRSLDTQSHTYRPDICRETDATLAWYREIIAEHYPDDPRMEELYRFRELWGTLYNIALGCGHADNPKPYKERKRDFLALFRSETLDAEKALDPQMIRRLDRLHRILASLARRKNFRAIWLLGKLEPLTYKLKIR